MKKKILSWMEKAETNDKLFYHFSRGYQSVLRHAIFIIHHIVIPNAINPNITPGSTYVNLFIDKTGGTRNSKKHS
jgi:hypothetical protein